MPSISNQPNHRLKPAASGRPMPECNRSPAPKADEIRFNENHPIQTSWTCNSKTL